MVGADRGRGRQGEGRQWDVVLTGGRADSGRADNGTWCKQGEGQTEGRPTGGRTDRRMGRRGGGQTERWRPEAEPSIHLTSVSEVII